MQDERLYFDGLLKLLHDDNYAIDILKCVHSQIPHAFVAAGFIRNRIWDHLYGNNGLYPDTDIDVIYFDKSNKNPEIDYALEASLEAKISAPWQVRNQARMHEYSGLKPFRSLEHAMAHWPETATAIGVRLSAEQKLEFIAPFGFDDLLNHTLRITPNMKKHNLPGFQRRFAEKGWLERWPRLKVLDQ
ncbi:nucleotidyltransferase family protein [Kordiimonas sp. SCSIO 12610]|uniref:nucleotidyltransferase family protein n=1 Tax=Kordiimonas sp. SCSIO 12610 TaxID=2829597 RepID=UPI0021097D6C|nr:nucleotidyltransferase family protein [Kordiimonas sp. SCSIO 12610]UTW55736.1 nucleotidyltransferase family protein [Kordiimonas sp. SCSIO 12610]